jgi:hypothetical protein
MLKRLQEKWGVGPFQFILILLTFAIGGSLSGYGAKWIMGLLGWEKSILWWVFYILVVTLLWPLCVISVSLFFGQFKFFKGYLKKIGKRIFSRNF